MLLCSRLDIDWEVATARRGNAVLRILDADLEDLPGVRFFAKA